mgnify:CR=1 FL=1
MQQAEEAGEPIDQQSAANPAPNNNSNNEAATAAQKPHLAPHRQFLRLCRNLCVVYLAFGLVFASPLYTMIALRPEGPASPLYQLPKILASPREEYFFASQSGQKLHGWLFRTPGSNRVILVHHGNAGNILHRLFIAKHCILTGSSVFIYDYRGYGKSEGSVALANLSEDGLSAYDFLAKQLKFSHIVNYGESIGSGVACLVSTQRPCDGVILQSGICSLPSVAKDGVFFLKMYPDSIYPQPHFENLHLVKELHKPLLVVHGMRDTMVPPRHSEKLFAAAAEPKQFVKLPACGHNDVGDKDEALFDKSLQDFINSIYERDSNKTTNGS